MKQLTRNGRNHSLDRVSSVGKHDGYYSCLISYTNAETTARKLKAIFPCLCGCSKLSKTMALYR